MGRLILKSRHRLLCGDSTQSSSLDRLLGRTRPSLLVTDPPYGVNYEGGSGNTDKRERLRGDENPELYVAAMTVAARHLDTEASVYLWHASIYADSVLTALRETGFEPRACIIWNKINATFGSFMSHYMPKHEPCIYAVRGSARWCGPTNEKTVWDIEQPSRNEFHPTQKPVECMARAIANHNSPEVLDLFLGSGTTLIAAEQLGRRCYGLEFEPAYCDVIVRRWENLTGEKAVRWDG
jgi:DNA modification methylase